MRPSRSTLARAIAVAVVFGALVVVGRLAGGGWRPASPTTATTVSLLPVPASPSTIPSPVAAHLRLGQVAAVTVAGNAVWAAHGCAISKVDPRTNRVVGGVVGLRPTRSGCLPVPALGCKGCGCPRPCRFRVVRGRGCAACPDGGRSCERVAGSTVGRRPIA